MELDAIAGVYIGGTSAAGGGASVSGSLLGSLMLVVIRSGLNFVLAKFNLNANSTYVTFVLTGAIVVVAVLMDVIKTRRANRVKVDLKALKAEKTDKESDFSIPVDVCEKILRFARCAVAVGWMKNKSYVNIGGVAMGIAGSYCDASMFQNYFGIRAEWVDMTEIVRRITLNIYDPAEYENALAWVKANCKEGFDCNASKNLPEIIKKSKVVAPNQDWEFITKMTMIMRGILFGNPKLDELGWHEEAPGKNAIAGGFQGQRNWTDWLPNADFTDAILASTFDWNGPKAPTPFATENDTLNGVAMMLGTLTSSSAPCFHDLRTYWSAEACERVTGEAPQGTAKDGFIHLINSGATALDGSGAAKDGLHKAVVGYAAR